MTDPLVSVHVMTYNQADFIADTIQSALDQTYENVQVVVGDDGSTDGTTEIVEDFAKRYPKKVLSVGGEHVGINANANRVLDACTGKYVAILNGDDLYEPTKLEKQVRWFEQDPRRALCAHDVAYFHDDPQKPYQLQSDITKPRTGKGAEDFLRYGVPFATVSVVLRRDCIPDYGIDPQLLVSFDWKLWIDCLDDGGHYGYIDEVLARYRMHAENSTTQWPEQIWIDAFVSLGSVEARRPDLAKACQAARALRFYQRGVFHHQTGDRHAARVDLWQSLKYNPALSWKVYAWLLKNEAPDSLDRVITTTGKQLKRFLER